MDSVALLDRLIAFPTVSRDSNLGLIGFVRDLLAGHGIACETFQNPGGDKANLFATVGPPGPAGIVLSGHTDVVPVDGQAWHSDPFRLHDDGGLLYGRGAADMKGFLACALRAALRAAATPLAAPLHLAFSYDEELGCLGVRPLLDHLAGRGFAARGVVVGEPTGMAVVTGHKGKIAARATCCGTAAHSALAPRALNAIHLATDLVGHLRRRQAALAEAGRHDPAYDVPYTTVHVGRIEGGIAANIVPERCLVGFEIRHLPEDDADAIFRGIAEDAAAIAAEHRARFPQAAIDLDITNTYPGLATPLREDLVSLLHGAGAAAPGAKVAFGTEGGLFRTRLGLPVVVCGPGSMEQGHKPDEFVSRDQLARCDAVLDALLDRLR